MASVIFKPTNPKEVTAVNVGNDGVLYHFYPGIPQDVPQEHLSAVTTALNLLGTTTSGTPADL